MIIPDANLLIYAHDERSVYHAQALRWWTKALAGPEPIGIPWVVVLAFTRLMTHTNVCENPLTIGQARDIVLSWFENSHIRLLQVGDRSVSRFFDLLEDVGTGGNLSTDALIALHALEHSATVYSNDRDFDRFAAIRRINPLGN